MPRSDDPSDGSSPISDSATIDLETPRDVDSLFACLADPRRRLVLEGLSERSGPVVVEELVGYIREREEWKTSDVPPDSAPVEITIALLHNHLPKLSEAGMIEIDHETNTVREGDCFETATALLQAV